MPAAIQTKTILQRLAGRLGLDGEFLGSLVETIFRPNFKRLGASVAVITLDESYRGAVVLGASQAVTVNLPPSGLGAGFLCSFLPLGAGSFIFAGIHVGGTTASTVGQSCTAMTLDDGSWVVGGSAA